MSALPTSYRGYKIKMYKFLSMINHTQPLYMGTIDRRISGWFQNRTSKMYIVAALNIKHGPMILYGLPRLSVPYTDMHCSLAYGVQ